MSSASLSFATRLRMKLRRRPRSCRKTAVTSCSWLAVIRPARSASSIPPCRRMGGRNIVGDAQKGASPAVIAPASAPQCRLDRRDVDFPHLHHRFERTLCRCAIGTGDRIREDARGDLPRQAPLVLAPAAYVFPAAVVDNRVPQAI